MTIPEVVLRRDLALRGVRVTLVERGELTSGTTGRHHGMLHSGGRYAVSGHESAVECIDENLILRRICPGSLELNDGLFIAVEDEDMEYLEPLLEGCEASRRASTTPKKDATTNNTPSTPPEHSLPSPAPKPTRSATRPTTITAAASQRTEADDPAVSYRYAWSTAFGIFTVAFARTTASSGEQRAAPVAYRAIARCA
jgi:hypothetical protein